MPRTAKAAIFFALMFASWQISGCAEQVDPWQGKSPRILTSFPPIYCFVMNVVDDEPAVRSVLQTTGPHDHQPTIEDLLLARRADLFFMNGLQLDDSLADNMRRTSANPKLEVVDLGYALDTKIPFAKKAEEHHGHAHGGEFDPHAWLGIPEAIQMVQQIRDKLK